MGPAIVKKSGKGEISASCIKHLLHKRTAANAKASKAKVTSRTRSGVSSKAKAGEDAGITRKRRYKRRRKVRRKRTAATKTSPAKSSPAKAKKVGVTIATQTADLPSDIEDDQQPSTSREPASRTAKQKKTKTAGVETESKVSVKTDDKWEAYRQALNAKKVKKVQEGYPELITISDDEARPSAEGGSVSGKSAAVSTAMGRISDASVSSPKADTSFANGEASTSGDRGRSGDHLSSSSRDGVRKQVIKKVAAPSGRRDKSSESAKKAAKTGKISKKKKGDFMNYYESEEDSDYQLPQEYEHIDKKAKLAAKQRKKQEDEMEMSKDPNFPLERRLIKGRKEPRTETQCTIDGLFQIAPVARALAKALPMKTLNSLGQVSRDFRDVVAYEKNLPRRQSFDFIHRQNVIVALDSTRVVPGSTLLGQLSDLYCDPEFVITFSTPNIMYTYRVHVSDSRVSGQGGQDLRGAIVDLLPKSLNRVFHIRTHAVMPPVPVPYHLRGKTEDHNGMHESARDLVMLCIPRIEGVNIWSEHMKDAELRRMLKTSGWLEARSDRHFLLPLIKDIEPVAPKFVMMFTRRMPEYSNVASPEFPVLLFNTLDSDQISHRHPVYDDPGADYGVQWLAFGGQGVTAYQIVIEITDESAERKAAIENLRDHFTAQQVMSGRMVIFYFRNVSKVEQKSAHFEAIFGGDITQMRELFPRVPVFGGSYLNAMGTVFTNNKSAPGFGKFVSGRHTTFVTALVMGNP